MCILLPLVYTWILKTPYISYFSQEQVSLETIMQPFQQFKFQQSTIFLYSYNHRSLSRTQETFVNHNKFNSCKTHKNTEIDQHQTYFLSSKHFRKLTDQHVTSNVPKFIFNEHKIITMQRISALDHDACNLHLLLTEMQMHQVAPDVFLDV